MSSSSPVSNSPPLPFPPTIPLFLPTSMPLCSLLSPLPFCVSSPPPHVSFLPSFSSHVLFPFPLLPPVFLVLFYLYPCLSYLLPFLTSSHPHFIPPHPCSPLHTLIFFPHNLFSIDFRLKKFRSATQPCIMVGLACHLFACIPARGAPRGCHRAGTRERKAWGNRMQRDY